MTKRYGADEREPEALESAPLIPDTSGIKVQPKPNENLSEDPKRDLIMANPWAKASLAITLTFGVVGYLDQVYSTPLTYYMYNELGITTQEYYVYKALKTVPIMLNVVFGFFGELYPINKKRSKWLMFIGLVISMACYIYLAAIGTPSYNQCLWTVLMATSGAHCASACAYILVQDRSEKESFKGRGRFMTTCLIVNSAGAFFGQVVSLFYGTTISTELGDDTYLLSMSDMWLCAAMAPALVAPWCFFVIEDDCEPAKFRAEIRKIMDCMAQPFVYKPILAMTAVKFLVFDNSANSTFLLDGCGITEFQYTVQTMASMGGAWATNAIYKRVFFTWEFRTVFALTVIVATAVKMSDYIAGHTSIARSQWPCFLYYGWDGLLADWASYTAIATHSVLIVIMCNGCGARTGKENLILNSMITAGWDLMQICSDYYSTWFNVSTEAISKGNYQGWYGMQLLTVIVTSIGLTMVPLIPTTRESFAAFISNCLKTEQRDYNVANGMLAWWSFAIVFTVAFAAFKDFFLGDSS